MTEYHVGRPHSLTEHGFEWVVMHLERMFNSRRVTNDGPYVQLLEKEMAGFLGVEHAVAVTNATVGLEIAAKALGLRGDVIMPAFTFVATAHAFSWVGLQPVFCDVSPDGHHIDPEAVATIAKYASAIVAVNLWGGACGIDRLQTIADQHGIPLIFDSAHAFGARTADGKRLGGFGACEVFSLHGTKMIHSLEGGILTTNDGELAEKFRRLRNFGFAGVDQVVSEGINAKMHEATAIIGLASIRRVPVILERNKVIRRRYQENLGAVMLEQSEGTNFHYHVMQVDAAIRDPLYAYLWERGVCARRYFYPGVHRTPPYNRPPIARLPRTDHLCKTLLALPSGGGMSVGDVDTICEIIQAGIKAVSA